MKDVHLAIYDNKNTGIVSAALHLEANKVILLHRKQHNVEGVKLILKERGIKCESQMVSFDPKQIRTILKYIFIANESSNLIFNASSGYRMMVLVALEQFTSQAKKVFVVDQFTNELHWLHENNKTPETLVSKLKIAEFLSVFSSKVISNGQSNPESQSRQELTHWLIENIEHFGSSLATLNHIAMKSEIGLQFHMDKSFTRRNILQQILSRFELAGLLHLQNNTVKFKNEESRFYTNGGWLENHVFSTLFYMKKAKGISDLSKGMEISRAKGSVSNEIDVIAVANNRLHLIECKTRKFTNKNHANTPGAASIYKLDTLKESMGGNSGKAMLVSYQKLSKYTEQRAKDLGIFCCSFKQLKQLKKYLADFIDFDA